MMFSSLGWRLPCRWHMPLQAAKVAMLLTFAVRPYCDSEVRRNGSSSV